MANNTMAKVRPTLTRTRTRTRTNNTMPKVHSLDGTTRTLTLRRLTILYHTPSHTLTSPRTPPYTRYQVLRENAHAMAITEPEIRVITDYEPKAFGLDVPESL